MDCPLKKVAVMETWPLVEVWLQDPGEGPGGPGSPLIFRPKWGPKSRKNFFWGLSPPPISGSGWPGVPLCEALDPSLDCNRFEGERERELMLLKLYSIIFCTDLVIDIDIDLERKFILPRGTQESQLVKTLNVKKKKRVEKLLKK